ncbi:hypothetical protein ACJW30_07G136600 [Castanea mollissima]
MRFMQTGDFESLFPIFSLLFLLMQSLVGAIFVQKVRDEHCTLNCLYDAHITQARLQHKSSEFLKKMPLIHKLFMLLKHDLYTSCYPQKRGSPQKTHKRDSSSFRGRKTG